MSLKLASMGSVITYAIFTVFPIIMFSIILGKFNGITKKAYKRAISKLSEIIFCYHHKYFSFSSCQTERQLRE